MGGIYIDKDSDNPLGVFMSYCPRCGGDSNTLYLTGNRKHKITCGCGTVNYCANNGDKCGNCGNQLLGYKKERFENHERLPGDLCEACETELKGHTDIVADGGVHFKCKECNCEGVIRNSDFAKRVREVHGTEYSEPGEDGKYKPCGIKFDKCSEHATG